ncbi:MAG: hypothetical protein M3Q65_08815 [Chloroflexota bacterium]|nr:hypothetical protein [Chloroflexota bacterium]
MAEHRAQEQPRERGQAIADLSNAVQEQARKGMQAVKSVVENMPTIVGAQTGGGAEAVVEKVAEEMSLPAAEQFIGRAQEQVWRQYEVAGQSAAAAIRAYNQVLATSADIAFGVVLRAWGCNRIAIDAANQAVEDTIKLQRRMMGEALQVYEDFISRLNEQVDGSKR